MISLDTLTRWLVAPAASEHLEFKESALPNDARGRAGAPFRRGVDRIDADRMGYRQRFGLSANKAESASRTIRDAVSADKIKIADPEQSSLRYRSYVPYWA